MHISLSHWYLYVDFFFFKTIYIITIGVSFFISSRFGHIESRKWIQYPHHCDDAASNTIQRSLYRLDRLEDKAKYCLFFFLPKRIIRKKQSHHHHRRNDWINTPMKIVIFSYFCCAKSTQYIRTPNGFRKAISFYLFIEKRQRTIQLSHMIRYFNRSIQEISIKFYCNDNLHGTKKDCVCCLETSQPIVYIGTSSSVTHKKIKESSTRLNSISISTWRCFVASHSNIFGQKNTQIREITFRAATF